MLIDGTVKSTVTDVPVATASVVKMPPAYIAIPDMFRRADPQHKTLFRRNENLPNGLLISLINMMII